MKSLFSIRNCKAFIVIFCLTSFSLTAQVGINTTEPDDGSILDISSENKGILVPRIDIPDLDAIAPITGGATQSLLVYNIGSTTEPGYYYWDTGKTKWIPLTTPDDDDFYEVGTTTPAQSITDDIWRTGKMAIGKTSASYPLDIEDADNTRALNVVLGGSTDAQTYAVYTSNENTSDNNHFGMYSLVENNTGTGNRYGIYTKVNIPGSQTNKAYGIYNDLTATSGGNGEQIGTFNRLGGDGVYRSKIGVNNYLTGNDNASHIGVSTNLSGTGTGNHTGVQNVVRGAGNLKGVYNTFNDQSGNGDNKGMETQNTNSGSGDHIGLYTSLSGNGNGIKTGVTNYISSNGSGIHTGISNTITGTGTGNHTGMYTNINSSNADNYGVRTEIDKTAVGKISYGTYNWLYNISGIGYAGYFTATGSGTNYAAVFNDGLVVVNESGNDNDFRVESDTNENMLFVDASANNVGIGTATPSAKLEVVGTIKATDINFTGIVSYGSNGDASSDPGLPVGGVYRVGNNLRIKL